MVLFVKLFGVAIVVMGIIFLQNPKALNQYLSFWKEDKRLRMGAILALLFGVIFLMAASECRLTLLINILGIWSIIKGVLLLTLAKKKIYAYLDWWLDKPVSTTRILSGIVLAFGILLIYSA